jgi:hypothetical protein
MEEKIENKDIMEVFKMVRSEISFLEFTINEFLTLKLADNFIKIYVKEEPFSHCRYLLILDPLKHKDQEEIDSIDEVKLLYNNDLEKEITPEELGITKEQEFWAHCSNLQAWAENDYNTRLLHSNLSFPLLKKLTEVGDEKARKVFKEEIGKRFVHGSCHYWNYSCNKIQYSTPKSCILHKGIVSKSFYFFY